MCRALTNHDKALNFTLSKTGTMEKEWDPTWVFTGAQILGAGWEHREEVIVIVQVKVGRPGCPGREVGGFRIQFKDTAQGIS